jgi:hypothetical protein
VTRGRDLYQSQEAAVDQINGADERAALAIVEHYDAQRAAHCAAAQERGAVYTLALTPSADERDRIAIRLIARARAAELRDPDWREAA